MKRCTKCLLPDTKPELGFHNGICDACIYAEEKELIDWDDRRRTLYNILESYRGQADYDCIIPVSGGKDSHYITYVIKKEFGLNPLCVNFRPRDFTELGRKNLENLSQSFNVDVLSLRTNEDVYKRLALYGLRNFGDAALPEHMGIFAFPTRTAIRYKIPLMVWGENIQREYGGKIMEMGWEWVNKHSGFFLDKFNPEELEGFTREELEPYIYPTKEEINSVPIKQINLGDYVKWDARRQVEIVKEYGFNVFDWHIENSYVNYENLDTKYVSLHDYFKFLKYGYGRATDHTSIDIRNERMTREEGLKLVKKYDGFVFSDTLEEFKKDFGLSDKEWESICNKFRMLESVH